MAFIRKWLKAYFGSIIGTCVGFPIFVSAATVFFYISPPLPLTILPKELSTSNWYAPVYGFLATCIATLLFAIPRSHFATAEGANVRIYRLLKSGQSELKARLGIEDYPDRTPRPMSLKEQLEATGMNTTDGRCSVVALREAYATYHDICDSLCDDHSGLQWVFGTGYVNTWGLLHRAEEALVEVEPVPAVIREAIEDQLSIDKSAIGNRDELLDKLIQAVKDLDPEAMVYFKEQQPDKNYTTLAKEIEKQNNVLCKVVNTLNQSASANEYIDPQELNLHSFISPTPQVEIRARAAIREVKHTLNRFREERRAGLVRARNHLLISIAITGFVTHLLLCMVILLDLPPFNTHQPYVIAGSAFYIVGAIAGLFGRFYNESVQGRVDEDQGLFLARLIAVPLLSGLAGIGGVFVTVMLPAVTGQGPISLAKIFSLNPQYLFAAAIFGFTPNLIIKSFQQKSEKYASDLASTRSGEGPSDQN